MQSELQTHTHTQNEDQCATCPILRKSMPIFNNTVQQLSPQTVLCIVYKPFW